jgi:hypothetical protein
MFSVAFSRPIPATHFQWCQPYAYSPWFATGHSVPRRVRRRVVPEKQARKQVDDVAYLGTSDQQIVYTHPRLKLAIDNLQREILFHTDDLISQIPSEILTQCFPQRQFRYELYPAHRARSDVQQRGDCMRQTMISARRKR